VPTGAPPRRERIRRDRPSAPDWACGWRPVPGGYIVSADLLSQGMFRWPLRWDNVEHTISRHPIQRSLP
jgi:hypothetical protein